MPPIQAWQSPSTLFTGFRRRLRRRGGERLQDLSFKHLDLLLGRLQLLLAESRELEAALVGGERLLERKLAAFHAGHDFFQLGERLLESKLARLAGFCAAVRAPCLCAPIRFRCGARYGLAHLLVRY